MKIVIVGGGAGGLELATTLGKKLARKKRAEIVLIDRNHTHVWKPLLHEVASGSLDADMDSVNYRAHAHKSGFSFKLGSLTGLNRDEKYIDLAPLCDEEGNEIMPARTERYDYLVLAIGSVSNDFSVPGVADNCIFLDRPDQALLFHRRLVNQFIGLNSEIARTSSERTLHIAIIGGGATGVELSAELFKAREWFASYGLNHIGKQHLKVSIIEAGPGLVPALSERISNAVAAELQNLGVEVCLSTSVASVAGNTIITSTGERIEADQIVWAAGVKAPEVLRKFEGLERNRIGQLRVNEFLQLSEDSNIFALGDCAACAIKSEQGEDRWVPPRAQSAHQMASTVGENIMKLLENKPLKAFKYQDYGSLVSLSHYTAFGKLMGGLAMGSMNVEGRLARLAYVSLYRMHQLAIHGWYRTLLVALASKINHFIRPRLKLH